MRARAWITLTALFLAATVGACASMRSSSGASNLVGQYAYTTTAHGQPVSGTITIARSQAQYTIVMTSGGFTRDITFTDVSITGNRVSATAPMADGGSVALHLAVTGDTITGDWSAASQNGELRGTRVSDAPK